MRGTMSKRAHLREDNVPPSIALRLFGLLAMLFLASLGLIFGRIYVLSLSPSDVKAWLEPASFWLVVALLVAFGVAMVSGIYVLAMRQRNWLRRHPNHPVKTNSRRPS